MPRQNSENFTAKHTHTHTHRKTNAILDRGNIENAKKINKLFQREADKRKTEKKFESQRRGTHETREFPSRANLISQISTSGTY